MHFSENQSETFKLTLFVEMFPAKKEITEKMKTREL